MRRRGFSLVELVVCLGALLWVMTLGLQGKAVFLQVLERELNRMEAQETLSALFALLEAPLAHAGLSLPEQWSQSLFKLSGIGTVPDWASWGKNIAVGNSVGGYSFWEVDDGQWGNSLRILSAVPVGAGVIKELELTPDGASELRLVGQWGISSQNMGIQRPAQWLLFPPEETPVFFRSWSLSGAGSSDYTIFGQVMASQRALFTWGMRGYRLLPLLLCCQNGIVYGNFQDQSGLQPLIAGIDSLSFSLARDQGVLRLRAESRGREEERTWALAN